MSIYERMDDELAAKDDRISMLERENAALRANAKEVFEYEAQMEELKSENAALREQLKEANRLLHIWSPESAKARKEAQP